MDIFGIGTRIMNSAHEQARLARGTGRTTVLSDMVQDGDIVVFATSEHAGEFARLQERRRHYARRYTPVTHDPRRSMGELHVKLKGLSGRVFFDHKWLEEYYSTVMRHAIGRVVDVSKLANREEL